jgi:hypothetical protein
VHPEITQALAAERIAALLAEGQRAPGAAGSPASQHGSVNAHAGETASVSIANVTPPSADRQEADAPSWVPVGLAVAAVAWGANQFSPLLLIYRQRLHLSAAIVDATFGLYAAGLIARTPDRRAPRRPLWAAPDSRVSARCLLPRDAFLDRGRRQLADAVHRTAAERHRKRACLRRRSHLDQGTLGNAWTSERRSTASHYRNDIRLRRWTLVAGLTAQWGPWRWGLPYLPHLVLTVLAIPVIATAQETRGHGRARVPRSRLPLTQMQRRRYLTLVLPMAPWVFVSAAIGLAYLPGLIDQRLHSHALLFTTLMVALTAAAGIAVQPGARRLAHHDARWLLVGALTTVTAGLVAASAAASTMSIPLAMASAAVLGAGYGACQVHGLQEVQLTAPAERLASVTAAYQAASYLGFAAPFLLAYAQRIESPQRLLLLLAMLAIATTITAAVQEVRTRPPRPRPPGARPRPSPWLGAPPRPRPQTEPERRSARSATCLNAH